MAEYIKNRKQAIIILHEIYGINDFIKDQCKQYDEAGFDVFCPNMFNNITFPYEKSSEAYDYFMREVGFERYVEINTMINQLKNKYEKVFMIGFSAGATIAWRCCENALCDGIISCYGSRIRDYIYINPVCPTFLIFAEYDSFDVNKVAAQLENKPNLEIVKLPAKHGFMDLYCLNYQNQQAANAANHIVNFLLKHAK
ncbi:dienelactone hydrolase family protein [Oscillospiraceae bacterium PP1C4]